MSKKPNVLFICTDQMRADAMGCSSDNLVHSPNLDRLAAEGCRFERAMTPDPVCVPARATMITGNYPHRCTGIKNNSGAVKADQTVMPKYFADHGYATYAAGKLHYVPYSPPGEERLTHGFEQVSIMESGRMLAQFDPKGELTGVEDYYDYLSDVGWHGYTRAHGIGNNDIHPGVSPLPEEHFVDTWVGTTTLKNLEQHRQAKADKPFFMFMSFPKPHAPYDPPEPYHAIHDPRKMPAPLVAKGNTLRSHNKEQESITHGWPIFSPEMKAVSKAYYYGLISCLDAQIGRVLDDLKANGELDNTIIIFTSDHGDMLGDFGYFAKSCFYRGSVEVPLIFRYPEKIKAGLVSDAFAGLQDIFPTLTSLAGIPFSDENIDGDNLATVLDGTGELQRDYFVSYYADTPEQTIMITDKYYKYIYAERGAIAEFYDLAQDPNELENIINAPAAKPEIDRLKTALQQWLKENGETQMMDLNGNFINSDPIDISKVEFKLNTMGWRWY